MNRDERIDEVLKALGAAEAPAGLEERVLRRMATRPVAARRRWLVPMAAVGAVAVMALVVGVRHRPAPVVVPAVKAVAAVEVVRPGDTHVSGARHGAPDSAKSAVRARVGKAAEVAQVSFPAPEAPLTEQEKLMVRFAQERRAEMAVAPHVLQQATVAADHALLTTEERLLVSVSRMRQPEVLDALDPMRRAAADAADEREFKAFIASHSGGTL